MLIEILLLLHARLFFTHHISVFILILIIIVIVLLDLHLLVLHLFCDRSNRDGFLSSWLDPPGGMHLDPVVLAGHSLRLQVASFVVVFDLFFPRNQAALVILFGIYFASTHECCLALLGTDLLVGGHALLLGVDAVEQARLQALPVELLLHSELVGARLVKEHRVVLLR